MNVLLLVSLCMLFGLYYVPPSSAFIDPGLVEVLKVKDEVNIILSFKIGTSRILESLRQMTFPNREVRLTTVGQALQEHAQFTQRNVLNYLSNEIISSNVKSLWITNQIYIQNANGPLVEGLMNQFPEISEIAEERVFEIDPMSNVETFNGRVNRYSIPWNLERIEVKQVWNMDGGNRGENVIVANIDTGVTLFHETLRHNYIVEPYGWFDPYTRSKRPFDDHGQGTHTMAIMVGDLGIGVAPGAMWMACRGCKANSCAEYALFACGEFVLCPTKSDGTGRDCTKAPHVVSNSWAFHGGQYFFKGIVDSWEAAGIVPVFPNGNTGPRCKSARSPADYHNAIAVGSTTFGDSLSPFSSKGPAVNGLIKPDVSAPGNRIVSASNMTFKSYVIASGTSMASAHVAGVIALMISRDNSLDYKQIKNYLLHGNEQQYLEKTNSTCGGIKDTQFPNNAYGNGRINALQSMVKLIEDSNRE